MSFLVNPSSHFPHHRPSAYRFFLAINASNCPGSISHRPYTIWQAYNKSFCNLSSTDCNAKFLLTLFVSFSRSFVLHLLRSSILVIFVVMFCVAFLCVSMLRCYIIVWITFIVLNFFFHLLAAYCFNIEYRSLKRQSIIQNPIEWNRNE